MLKEKQDSDLMNDLLEEKLASRIDYKERHEVDKILKKAHFNWQPLAIDTREAAAAYALSRQASGAFMLAPNYAELARVLDEFEGHDFSPVSVLDYGCGVGSGFWAVNERFGLKVKEFCMVDPSIMLCQLAMDVMRDKNGVLPSSINCRRHLVPSLQTKYDLVIAHRTLCEIGSQESRLETVASLWKRTKRFLVLIDSGTKDSFDALMEARDFLLISGSQLHLEETSELLKVPSEIELPTALPSATVYAPCPHDLGCPKLRISTCTIPVRWRVIRADGKRSRYERSGTETGNISFVILEKGQRTPDDAVTRILKIRQSNGHVTCDVCTAFQGIQRLTVSKRAGVLYQRARTRKDGELFPLDMKPIATEDVFNVFTDGQVIDQEDKS
ncbi:unnamed protein product [Heligmosomoides polygyrus]|uniref:Methyltransferase-like protein 17, mitochondrial n=1 Tax=Heligmosomoides polygyrus TaxID=6339 RepID=A0A183FE42_HELPZ|nr:unnamed protein product [Heligmosomoides polygyrus]